MEPFSALLALCVENSPVMGEFLSQRSVTRSSDVWLNNRDAGDLKRHRAHYDVSVMVKSAHFLGIYWIWYLNLWYIHIPSLFTTYQHFTENICSFIGLLLMGSQKYSTAENILCISIRFDVSNGVNIMFVLRVFWVHRAFQILLQFRCPQSVYEVLLNFRRVYYLPKHLLSRDMRLSHHCTRFNMDQWANSPLRPLFSGALKPYIEIDYIIFYH